MTVEELEKHCLFSPAEIERALTKCPLVMMDDTASPLQWYKISSKFFYSTVLDVLQQCILHRISLHSFSLDAVLQTKSYISHTFIVLLIRFLHPRNKLFNSWSAIRNPFKAQPSPFHESSSSTHSRDLHSCAKRVFLLVVYQNRPHGVAV